jgi:CubicO group peptidase (beta-lactamase class C family)
MDQFINSPDDFSSKSDAMILRYEILLSSLRHAFWPLVALCISAPLLIGCKIRIDVPAHGYVTTQSGNHRCAARNSCLIDVKDEHFDETFIAIPHAGYQFVGWQQTKGHLCAGFSANCRLMTTFFGGYPELMQLLSEDTTFPLAPVFVEKRRYDFSSLNSYMEQITAETPEIAGVSVLIVDKYRGVLHQYASGDMGLDAVVQLRSVSKLATVSLIMAMQMRSRFNFDVATPIGDYLPFEGVYGDRTTEQLLSNTSGIPGNYFHDIYGPHLCQFVGTGSLADCGRTIYQYLLPGVYPPGTVYSYGGSQWQLAGLVAETVAGAKWNALFNRFIRTPCGMNVFEYGNMLTPEATAEWDGDPASLTGKNNPNVEAGAISNLHDLGRLLQMHLRDGWCGPHQVMAAGAAEFLRLDRKLPVMPPQEGEDTGYGMAWWIRPETEEWHEGIYYVPGALGSHIWIDEFGDYGGVFLVQGELAGRVPDNIWFFVYGGLFQVVREIMAEAAD